MALFYFIVSFDIKERLNFRGNIMALSSYGSHCDVKHISPQCLDETGIRGFYDFYGKIQ
jgi:hypothetical protein